MEGGRDGRVDTQTDRWREGGLGGWTEGWKGGRREGRVERGREGESDGWVDIVLTKGGGGKSGKRGGMNGWWMEGRIEGWKEGVREGGRKEVRSDSTKSSCSRSCSHICRHSLPTVGLLTFSLAAILSECSDLAHLCDLILYPIHSTVQIP